jgi:hypothetical protein
LSQVKQHSLGGKRKAGESFEEADPAKKKKPAGDGEEEMEGIVKDKGKGRAVESLEEGEIIEETPKDKGKGRAVESLEEGEIIEETPKDKGKGRAVEKKPEEPDLEDEYFEEAKKLGRDTKKRGQYFPDILGTRRLRMWAGDDTKKGDGITGTAGLPNWAETGRPFQPWDDHVRPFKIIYVESMDYTDSHSGYSYTSEEGQEDSRPINPTTVVGINIRFL